jgi:hypothetical protein
MLKFPVLVLLLTNVGEGRVAQETNKAPDVIAPYPETAQAMPSVAPAPETAKVDAESLAAAKIRSLNARLIDAKLTIAQTNGQIEALKSRSDSDQTELDKISRERQGLNSKLASVSAERDNALSDIKRLIEEKARDERKYEDLSAWNRKFYALHFVIILLVPLGLFLYFALRRQNAAILARLPTEETKDKLRQLRERAEGAERDHRDAMLIIATAKGEIGRLVLLQQGSDATIARMAEEATGLANENAMLKTAIRTLKETAAMVNGGAHEPPATAPDLGNDPALVAAAAQAIDAIEASRAPLQDDQCGAVPNAVDPADEATRKLEEPHSEAGTAILPQSDLPMITDENPAGGSSR